MRPTVALVLLALAPAAVAADVVVRVSGGRVDLTATAAPLGDVLDRLARQTGMKVVYEGPAPRPLVTLSIQGRTPAEAVLSVFEGLGVNFVLLSDSTGAAVQTLIVAGASAAAAPASSATPSRPPAGPRRTFGSPPGSSPEGGDATFETVEEDPPEEPTIPGFPPDTEITDPASGSPIALPGANPAAEGAARQPPGGVPIQPPVASPGFSASPFTPQPQPFPPRVPGVAAPTPANPTPGENAPPAVPPQ